MITPPTLNYSNATWAGYGWTSSTKADAQWNVPAFPYKKPLSASEKANHTGMAIWAGLGGRAQPFIEQIGIYDTVTAGKVNWAGLYEFYPYPSVGIPAADEISPGDSMIAHVTRSGYNYTLSLQDVGPHHRWTFTVKKAFGHVENEGEVIAEEFIYPGYPQSPVTSFSPVVARTSGNPNDEFYTPWAHAVKNSTSKVTIVHN